MNHSLSRHLNVLVMHPDPIVRAGLVAALRQHTSFGIFVHGVEASESECPSIDVVIADYNSAMLLSGSEGRKRHGQVESRILVLTANDREADIRRAIQAGIHGYVLLGGTLDELADGVTAVGNGLRFLCPAAAQRMADSLAGVTLTARESEVLRLVATGQPNKAIARQLAIELGTVKSHVSAIMTKLGAISRTQAASIAVDRGLVGESRSAPSATYPAHSHSVEARAQFA